VIEKRWVLTHVACVYSLRFNRVTLSCSLGHLATPEARYSIDYNQPCRIVLSTPFVNIIMTTKVASTRPVRDIPLAICSMSVGRACQHDFEPKIRAIAQAGYKAIEVFYEDIELPAMSNCKGFFDDRVLSSATKCRALCDEHGLEISCLQPFMNYGGIVDRNIHEEKIAQLKMFLKIATVLEVNLIIVPSMFPAQPFPTTGALHALVTDYQQIADLAAAQRPPVRIALEAMAWGAHVRTWQDCWEIIQKVDRPNFGLCLDSWQILGRIWGDPTVSGGKRVNADRILQQNCAQLAASVPLEKIYYVQIADAAQMDPPLSPGHPLHVPEQNYLMTWSRNARLFPLEAHLGAYMPIIHLLKTWIVDMGYRGYVGLEIFNRSLYEPGLDTVKKHAERGIMSWERCVQQLQAIENSSKPSRPEGPTVDRHSGGLTTDGSYHKTSRTNSMTVISSKDLVAVNRREACMASVLKL
jgi:4-hydroxyphenylpyruvate dioxygenase